MNTKENDWGNKLPYQLECNLFNILFKNDKGKYLTTYFPSQLFIV